MTKREKVREQRRESGNRVQDYERERERERSWVTCERDDRE